MKVEGDHPVLVRAEIEARQGNTTDQAFVCRELEVCLDPAISVPHTEDTLQQPHPSRDVKSPHLATKWPHPHPRHQENLRLYHGNLELQENYLKDPGRTRNRKVFWVFAHRPEPGSFTDIKTISLMEPQRNLISKIGCWKRNIKEQEKMEWFWREGARIG